MPTGSAVLLAVVAAALLATALPLLTYTTSLALFGFAHVASELRYVDRRFGRALSRRLLAALGTLLAGVVVLRLLRLLDVVPAPLTARLEVGLVLLLALAPLPALTRGRGLPLLLGCLTVALLGVGLALSPVATLLTLAVVHNLTPVGFLVDAAPPGRRAAVAVAALLAFVGAPVVVATGLPHALLAGLGLTSSTATLLPAGPLAAHLGAYLPAAWHDAAWAEAAFSGIVCAQLLHYAAVLHVLPRVGSALPAPLVPWPSGWLFWGAVAVVTVPLFVGFVWSFRDARAVYGIAAAVHAWIEVPLLLLLLAPLAAPPRVALSAG